MTLTTQETEKLKEWANKTFFEPNHKDILAFDINAEIDRKLNYEENKILLREKLKSFLNILSTKEELKTDKEKEQNEFIKKAELEEEENKKAFYNELSKIKDNLKKELDIFKIPAEYIKSVARGFNKGMLFFGSAGTGKTFLSRQILLKENVQFVESRGVSSALALYHFLYYNNNENTVLLFDDVHGLINNPNAFSILLGALWDGLISWNTTSDKLEVPTQFLFKSKIIIIANNINKIEGIEVLKSRCLCYELKLTWQEKIESMYLIAQQKDDKLSKNERIEIINFIEQNSDESTENLDLRTQQKIEKLYLFNKEKWKELSLPLLNFNKSKKILLEVLKKHNSMKEAEKEFIEESGLSRRQFYYLKKSLEIK